MFADRCKIRWKAKRRESHFWLLFVATILLLLRQGINREILIKTFSHLVQIRKKHMNWIMVLWTKTMVQALVKVKKENKGRSRERLTVANIRKSMRAKGLFWKRIWRVNVQTNQEVETFPLFLKMRYISIMKWRNMNYCEKNPKNMKVCFKVFFLFVGFSGMIKFRLDNSRQNGFQERPGSVWFKCKKSTEISLYCIFTN